MARNGTARKLEPPGDEEPPYGPKPIINGRVPQHLSDEARYFVALQGHPYTLSRFLAEAIELKLVRERRLHNDGRPFDPPPGVTKLKQGRPMKLPPTMRRPRPVRK